MKDRRRRSRMRALRLYTLVLRLYPRAHRQAFGAQMQQTFVDHYRDTERNYGRVGITLWLGVVSDAVWSIGREYLGVFFTALAYPGLRIFGPPGIILFASILASMAGDRRLLGYCVLAATLLFALASPTSIVSKLVLGTGGFIVALSGVLLAALTGQWRDLFDPILFLLTLFFVAKAAFGIWARLMGGRQVLWSREELCWGLVVTALLLLASCIALIPPEDAGVQLAILIGVPSPMVCGVAGAFVSRAHGSTQAGFFAGMAALAIGLMVWLIYFPFLIVLATWMAGSTGTGSHLTATAAGHLWQTAAVWGKELRVIPRFLPALLVTGLLGGAMGTLCGFSPVEAETQRVLSSADAKPYGTCAGCGARTWERTSTCWCCGRKLVRE